jgi:hypothetical protein
MPEMELEQLGVPPQPDTVAGIPTPDPSVFLKRGGMFDLPRYPNTAHRKWHPTNG